MGCVRAKPVELGCLASPPTTRIRLATSKHGVMLTEATGNAHVVVRDDAELGYVEV